MHSIAAFICDALALALTATEELQRGGAKRALATMCIGVGQGIAMVIERV